jgi:predicted small lipoprotein YifL
MQQLITALALLTLLLAGCGQTGPLYLPGNAPEQADNQAQQPTANDDPAAPE